MVEVGPLLLELRHVLFPRCDASGGAGAACAADARGAHGAAGKRAQIEGDRADLAPELFDVLPDISIDYAVMEKSSRVAVVPAAFAWSDVGSWNAVSELVAADAHGNRAQGECMFVDSANCYVQSSGRMVAAVGWTA